MKGVKKYRIKASYITWLVNVFVRTCFRWRMSIIVYCDI